MNNGGVCHWLHFPVCVPLGLSTKKKPAGLVNAQRPQGGISGNGPHEMGYSKRCGTDSEDWIDCMTENSIAADERAFLRRCVELAHEALEAGDEPFGSILVSADGDVLFEDRNRVASGDNTQHPEFAIARWAAANLSPEERAVATAYTSGEHCPMCAAAHAWVGLGRIVYASSSQQLLQWHRELGIQDGPVASLPINAVAPSVPVAGPDPELSDEVRELHARSRQIRQEK